MDIVSYGPNDQMTEQTPDGLVLARAGDLQKSHGAPKHIDPQLQLATSNPDLKEAPVKIEL